MKVIHGLDHIDASGLSRNHIEVPTSLILMDDTGEMEDPRVIAFWLTCSLYIARLLLGGRIEGAAKWSDSIWVRKGIVASEIRLQRSELWHWDGDDLILDVYDKPGDVKYLTSVHNSKENGKKGGRPPKGSGPPPLNGRRACNGSGGSLSGGTNNTGETPTSGDRSVAGHDPMSIEDDFGIK